MSPMMIGGLVAGAVAIAVIARVLTKSHRYPPVDLADIDRHALAARMEKILEDSEQWPASLTDDSVTVSTSLEPFVVRTVRYQVDVETDFERAVAHVKKLSDCGPGMIEKPDKIEQTLYDKNRGGEDHEWARRSVHISPPPGGSRDTVVVYYEDRPTPKSYRIVFQSIDSIDAKPIEPWEGASRFKVNPAIFTVDETATGKVRIRKVEAVDPQGMVSPLLNNYFVALAFFRKYMFEEAKVMRDALITAAA